MAKAKKKFPKTESVTMAEKALQAATMAKLKADATYEVMLAKVNKDELDKGAAKAKSAKGKLNILAEGDSWFKYGCGIGVITQLKSKLDTRANITNLATGGHTMKKMLTLPERAEFVQALHKGADKKGKPWDAILFSGGGNDFCGKLFHTWLLPFSGQTDPAAAIDRTTWEPKLKEMADLFDFLGKLVATHVPGAMVHLNLYDFAIPNNKGAGPAGPWLAPGFKKRGYPANLAFRTEVVKLLLQEFARMVAVVATSNLNLNLVPTQGKLMANEWDNELHPKDPGFGKIADLFAEAVFPGG